MFLQLNYQKLVVYDSAKILLKLCYKATMKFPPEERFNLTSQIRRAALSVCLNISEGASRRSQLERIRFFEISRGSLAEIDAAFDIAVSLNYCSPGEVSELGYMMVKCFKLLSGLIK